MWILNSQTATVLTEFICHNIKYLGITRPIVCTCYFQCKSIEYKFLEVTRSIVFRYYFSSKRPLAGNLPVAKRQQKRLKTSSKNKKIKKLKKIKNLRWPQTHWSEGSTHCHGNCLTSCTAFVRHGHTIGMFIIIHRTSELHFRDVLRPSIRQRSLFFRHSVRAIPSTKFLSSGLLAVACPLYLSDFCFSLFSLFNATFAGVFTFTLSSVYYTTTVYGWTVCLYLTLFTSQLKLQKFRVQSRNASFRVRSIKRKSCEVFKSVDLFIYARFFIYILHIHV